MDDLFSECVLTGNSVPQHSESDLSCIIERLNSDELHSDNDNDDLNLSQVLSRNLNPMNHVFDNSNKSNDCNQDSLNNAQDIVNVDNFDFNNVLHQNPQLLNENVVNVEQFSTHNLLNNNDVANNILIDNSREDAASAYSQELSPTDRNLYFNRFTTVYKVLPELSRPSQVSVPFGSLARSVKQKDVQCNSLPCTDFINKKLLHATNVLRGDFKNHTSESGIVQAFTSTKAGSAPFNKLPYKPKWLYNVHEKSFPVQTEVDHDFQDLNIPNSADFNFNKKEINNMERACHNVLSANVYSEIYLECMNKLIKQCGLTDAQNIVIKDMINALAYVNEFMVDQVTYLKAGLVHKFRTTLLDKTSYLPSYSKKFLLLQKINSDFVFNKQINIVVKQKDEKCVRDNNGRLAASLNSLARGFGNNTSHRGQYQNPGKRGRKGRNKGKMFQNSNPQGNYGNRVKNHNFCGFNKNNGKQANKGNQNTGQNASKN